MGEELDLNNIEDIGHKIISYTIKVHRYLGPGLLESAYQKCLT
ncbi:MAG: GxxExxY protein [Spirochaetota bacterium]|nr:GxxExxY protein [Spirochaetota bacterium]